MQIEQTWFGGDWSAVPTSQLLQPVWSQVYTMQVADHHTACRLMSGRCAIDRGSGVTCGG